jgi:2-polyprenyl-6-methoxyphenol hydroxylase-like FAD-dependent oxidoreductase
MQRLSFFAGNGDWPGCKIESQARGTRLLETLTTTCVIAGGGPAGMMAGYLLARAGIDVIVLEKHKDFLRDFRGDTIHPSTLEIIAELGLIDTFLTRPHTEVREIAVEIGKERFTVGDFTHLPTRCKFLALMPQWDFLDFLLAEAERFPTFRLRMEAEVTDLLAKRGRIAGVLARTPDGLYEIRARLVIGADGRHSTVRAKSNLRVKEFGAPFDVLWMRLPREQGDPDEPVARFQGGDFFIMLNRGDYWQCALVIPKGAFGAFKTEGITGFRARLRTVAGFARERVETIQTFDDVSLLNVKVDRLERWARRGLLCIGDAAHAMSPVGGVGINLAIQDAVAAANLLAPVLRRRTPRLGDLNKVQRRRLWPTRLTQWVQVQIQNRVLAPNFRARQTPKPPWIIHLLNRWPSLRRFPARFVGIGVRPEHVKIAEASRK